MARIPEPQTSGRIAKSSTCSEAQSFDKAFLGGYQCQSWQWMQKIFPMVSLPRNLPSEDCSPKEMVPTKFS